MLYSYTTHCALRQLKIVPQEKKDPEPAPAQEPAPVDPPVDTRKLREENENNEVMLKCNWESNQVTAVREVFNKFDNDGSGNINRKELKQCAKQCGEVLTNEELDELLAQVDDDGDGQVNFVEFAEMLKKNK